MESALHQNIPGPASKYLVYTSAGDNAKILDWLGADRIFDVWISYYGSQVNRYKEDGDFYNARKGGKFPNLHYVYQNWAHILEQYEAIFIVDDDIIINSSSIGRLFKIRERLDLWILQPAFHRTGKISHPITRAKRNNFLRYTNFVEVTCPLFRKDKLDEFMKVYDPVLVGWGIDWWYMSLFGSEARGKVAVVDEITCINPHNWMKGGSRDIDALEHRSARIANWERIK